MKNIQLSDGIKFPLKLLNCSSIHSPLCSHSVQYSLTCISFCSAVAGCCCFLNPDSQFLLIMITRTLRSEFSSALRKTFTMAGYRYRSNYHNHISIIYYVHTDRSLNCDPVVSQNITEHIVTLSYMLICNHRIEWGCVHGWELIKIASAVSRPRL